MNKIVLIITFLTLCLSITFCANEVTKESNPLIGNWTVIKFYTKDKVYDGPGNKHKSINFQFNNDLTFLVTRIEKSGTLNKDSGTYEVIDDETFNMIRNGQKYKAEFIFEGDHLVISDVKNGTGIILRKIS